MESKDNSTLVSREAVLASLRAVSGQDVDISMIAVTLMSWWGSVSAFPEKYSDHDFRTLKQGYRQLSEKGYL